jgi:hypothetical protein
VEGPEIGDEGQKRKIYIFGFIFVESTKGFVRLQTI